MRESGLKYTGQKANEQGKKPYSVERGERILESSKCSKRCELQKKGRHCVLVSENTLKEIFSQFWYNMNWDQKKVYVLGLIERKETASSTTNQSGRNFTYTYFLRVNDERVQVCKEMFLSTLGLHEKMVYKWIGKAKVGVPPRQETRQIECQCQSIQGSILMSCLKFHLTIVEHPQVKNT